MMFGYSFIFLCHLILADTYQNANDFRHISYQDLQLSFSRFSQTGVQTYNQLLFDVARNQVLVGARDVLYRLSLPHLHLLENATWPASNEKTLLCTTKGQTEANCHNFIKVLLTNGKHLFTCGTNAFSPMCSWREIENISHVIEWVDGKAKCPYNPTANITALMSSMGDYYVGGPTDFLASDSTIYRSMGLQHTLRTKQYDSMWLNEPQFVGSFETDTFIYFLFREAAVEYINCGKIVYSRIARVCKNDNGGQLMLKDNWTTFVKARFNCSISGDYPFYFDEIQATAYVAEHNLVYATFTTPSNSIAGSAICSFNLTAINAAFSGPFKYQQNTASSWNKHYSQHQDHLKCSTRLHNGLLESSKYQLMDNAVQATTLSPLYVAELERFTHITIDVTATKLHESVHVIFVATHEGFIKKLMIHPRTQETCIVEIWQPVHHKTIPILNIQYLKETNSIYVSTENELLRIPAHHCKRHVSRDSCLNAMDPYCGWNEFEDSCTTAPNSDPLDKQWIQSVTSCPILNAPVDGGWSSWSDWAPCLHQNSVDTVSTDECLCQTRHCNNPSPQNGGEPCMGSSIAVTNCTVHGGWTPWSAWSACSATCGVAVKTRRRTCTNPAPAHGGRVCVGQDRTEALCAGNPPCPAPITSPQDGQWGEWEKWEPCSSSCGGGFMKRYRRCNNPPPMYGGQDCIGCNVEYEICNSHPCPEQRRHSPWTPWLITNASNQNGDYTERRFKFVCRGPVQDSYQLKVSLYKDEVRVCRDGLCSANGNGNEDNSHWSSWTPWSECSVTCGDGHQKRTRICQGQEDCHGVPIQTKPCNLEPCRDLWGCWSDWSPCSVSCGWGVRKRHRGCLGESCEGPYVEEEPCEQPPCSSLLGWDSWTSWSLCDENYEQHRKRKCRSLNPGLFMCQGPDKETRICTHDAINDFTASSSESEDLSPSAGVVIACMSAGFIIGLMCAFLMTYFIYFRKKKSNIPSSPHYISAKQNPYITVPLQEVSSKRHCASTSNSILNNSCNGTLKSNKCYDYETATIKRNSHGVNNGHAKSDMLVEKYYYE